jgi:hypothetical protein
MVCQYYSFILYIPIQHVRIAVTCTNKIERILMGNEAKRVKYGNRTIFVPKNQSGYMRCNMILVSRGYTIMSICPKSKTERHRWEYGHISMLDQARGWKEPRCIHCGMTKSQARMWEPELGEEVELLDEDELLIDDLKVLMDFCDTNAINQHPFYSPQYELEYA